MSEPEQPVHPPLCLGMILADALYRDAVSGKMTILGTFTNVLCQDFPATHGGMAVYFLLTDGKGKTPWQLKLVRLAENNDDEEVAAEGGEIEFSDPRVVVEAGVFLANIPFPAPGEYRLQLYCAGQFVLERRIVAVPVPGSSPEELPP